MLHEFLSRHRDEIIERCEASFRRRDPERPREDLLVTIPRFVDEIIKAERREAGIPEHSTLPGETEEARVHGENRFHRGYKIRDVVMDYGTISQTIGDLAVEHGIELDARSYRVLNQCLDAGVAQALEIFYELSVQRTHREFAEWLGYLVHELRNALSSAVLAYSFLRSGEVGLESKTARILERAFNQLEALVAQTLVTVQLKSGTPPAREPVPLRELVEDIEAAAQLERGIKLEIDIAADLTLLVDPRLIASALTNLVQNAIKFTRPGGRIEVRAQRSAGGLVIEIEDECGGLNGPPEQLFEPFVQRE
jgi:signal transduction histidine kinase